MFQVAFVFLSLLSALLAQPSTTPMPPFIWTPDEACQIYYGPDYIYVRSMSETVDCYMITCQSISNPMITVPIMAFDGIMCNPKSVCFANMCTFFPDAPKTVFYDQPIGNNTCSSYLGTNTTMAISFCSTIEGNKRCPVTCTRYASNPTCEDTAQECANLGRFCNSTYPGTSKLVQDVCPLSCNRCPINPCNSNPCPAGKICTRVGVYNYGCA